MLRKLTNTTRSCLHDVEGELLVSWATAQQINAQQKVDYSIDEGFKKYWIDLGTSTLFEGEFLWDCISRIHRDILEVWNFHDPKNLLLEEKFCAEMVKLVEPLLKSEPHTESLTTTSELISMAANISATFGQILGGFGIAAFVIKFLYAKYQKSSVIALCFGAYIVDLTLILHALFLGTLPQEPPRPVLGSYPRYCAKLQHLRCFENPSACS
ncbi:hypothetical protein K435DRAFT_246795 [Dendrothele bispora CBS 962.96]|uniref:Uncharacterized protein n=1 Tax=Dendrothele bispora (strain CBS 962.96) TaxID=1314807 RepID=A0A4S8LPJ5_DENBC|nr:hypothetical protein K435DRAFT_246795 [Dendrothele bispora CBS 962.96]